MNNIFTCFLTLFHEALPSETQGTDDDDNAEEDKAVSLDNEDEVNVSFGKI